MKLNLFVLIAMFAAVTANAQSNSASRSESKVDTSDLSEVSASSVKMSIKAGPSFSNIAIPDDNSGTLKSKTDLMAGLEFDFPISSSFALVTGANYVSKGTQSNDNTPGATFSSQFNLNYLEMPLMLKLNMGLGSSSMLSLSAGGYAAYAISKKVSLKFNNEEIISDDLNKSFTDQLNNFDYGARFGLGFEQAMSSSVSFLIGANYDLGLRTVAKNGDPGKNRSIIANLGLGFYL